MNRFLVISLLLLCSVCSYGQSQKYAQVLKKFQEHYNANHSEALFEMLSPSFQKSIGIKKLTATFDTYYKYFGKINSTEFTLKEGSVEQFLAHFDHGKQHISLVVSSEGAISGLRFKPLENEVGKLDRNVTAFQLPFKGEWFTFWGGTTKGQNYHVVNQTQQGAFDFIILDKNNKSYVRSGTRNEDYYAFGKPLYAVCDAEVIEVIKGVEDNRPTLQNPLQASGNSITLKTKNEEYIVYSHFEKESIKVVQGQKVKKGQYLGNVGNSGNSTEPHLHLHLMDSPNRLGAIGAPSFFEQIWVNGAIKTDYSPIKGDRISMPK